MGKPNILHIFTDQQRFDTICALGNPIIRTPNLDRLCREGTVFTQAFTPSPVCVSGRCSMIFGQYPASTNCFANHDMPTDGRETFMTALTRSGYNTHSIGKCHFTPDPTEMRGFVSRQRTEGWISDIEKNEYKKYLRDAGQGHIMHALGIRGEMYYIPQASQMPIEHHITQWTADESIRFVEENSSGDSPWYLFSSFDDPHPPF
ncbi:MAG TPA: arylsulfatase, partial [Phycisphaerae bacterium]|nr:arylsulfatase [Phycisphaerae bacterium]